MSSLPAPWQGAGGFMGWGIKKQGGSEAWGEMWQTAWSRSLASRWRLPYTSGQLCSLSLLRVLTPPLPSPPPCMNTLHPPPATSDQDCVSDRWTIKGCRWKVRENDLNPEPFCWDLGPPVSFLCLSLSAPVWALTSLSSGQRAAGVLDELVGRYRDQIRLGMSKHSSLKCSANVEDYY